MHILPEDADPNKCILAGAIVWILGFTSVLCWSILQVPDGGGTAAWVPDVFCRESFLIVRLYPESKCTFYLSGYLPTHLTYRFSTDTQQPLRPFIFVLPSFFWPFTLVFLTAKSAEKYCGVPLARRTRRRRRSGRRSRRESHDVEEAYTLLLRDGDGDDDDDESDDYSFDGEDGIPMSDLSDLSSLSSEESPRSSLERAPPSPPTAMMEVPAVLTSPRLFRFIPYQPTPPASLRRI